MPWNFGVFRKKLDLNLKHEQQRHFCGESNVSRKLPGRSDWQQQEDLSILLSEFSRMDKLIAAALYGQFHS